MTVQVIESPRSYLKLTTFDQHNTLKRDGTYCRGDLEFKIHIVDDMSGSDAGKLTVNLWANRDRLTMVCSECGDEQ